MRQGKFNIVIGAQAGSESKGKLAAYLAAKFSPEVITMASCPNSGHTAVVNGVKYVSYHLPISWVTSTDSLILLGPTSTIRLPILLDEIEGLHVPEDKLLIHPRAIMIRDHYLKVERDKGLLKIGSTNQGVGVARREKLMRGPDITFAKDVPELKKYINDTVSVVNDCLEEGGTVLCEMTQGFDLCLEHGIDPMYSTSKMIHPSMGMAEAGVSPRWIGDIYGVLRPYPIRVNNREGSSGPYAEAKEITWSDVGRRCGYPDPDNLVEITTTTKLPRRVFEFSVQRFNRFCQMCRPAFLCLQFANYVDHRAFGVSSFDRLPLPVSAFIANLEIMSGVKVAYVGTGPDHLQMIDRRMDEWKGGK